VPKADSGAGIFGTGIDRDDELEEAKERVIQELCESSRRRGNRVNGSVSLDEAPVIHSSLTWTNASSWRGSLNNPRSVRFSDAVALVEAFGFRLSRVRGSHHLFVHPGIAELVNFQEVHGQAKPYQVRQFLKVVERHNLRLGGEE